MPERDGAGATRGSSILLGCALAATACGGPDSGPAFVERDSAGLVIAESSQPVWGASEAWTIEPEPILGVGQVEGDPRYLFQRVVDAERVGDRLVVADGDALVVRTYSLEGAFLAEFGGEGEGPGEFRSISGMWAIGPEEVAVYDGRSYRVTELDLGGGAPATVRVSREGGRPDVSHGGFSDGSFVSNRFVAVGIAEADVGRDRMELLRYSRNGDFLGSLATVLGMRRYVLPEGGTSVDPYTPWAHVGVRGDRLYHADSARPEIRVVDPRGAPLRLIRWRVTPHSRDAAMPTLASALAAREDRRGSMWDPGLVPTAEGVPVFANLLVDPRGALWVKRYDVPADALWLGGSRGGPGGEWWIFGPDGRWLGSVAMPGDLKPLSVEDDAVVGVRTDRLGVQYVRVHRLNRG